MRVTQTWRTGTVFTMDLGPDRRLEVRDDICTGWEWMLHDSGRSVVFSQSSTARAGRLAAVREAKKRGWV